MWLGKMGVMRTQQGAWMWLPPAAGTPGQEMRSQTDILPQRAQGLAGSVTSDSAPSMGTLSVL